MPSLPAAYRRRPPVFFLTLLAAQHSIGFVTVVSSASFEFHLNQVSVHFRVSSGSVYIRSRETKAGLFLGAGVLAQCSLVSSVGLSYRRPKEQPAATIEML
jgi:hypothetical protein